MLTERDLRVIEARLNKANGPHWYLATDYHEYDYVDGLGAEVLERVPYNALRCSPEPTNDLLEIGSHEIGVIHNEADGLFIAHARQDVPILIAEIRRLQALIGLGSELLSMDLNENIT